MPPAYFLFPKMLFPRLSGYADGVLFPAFQVAEMHTEPFGIRLLGQVQTVSYLPYLLTLTVVEKHMVIVHQVCDGDFV